MSRSVLLMCSFLMLLFSACFTKEHEQQIEKISRGLLSTNDVVDFSDLPDALQSDSDNRWILKILNFETTQGSAYGTGLAYWGNYRSKPETIEEAFRYFRRDFLPRVKSYPQGVRERLGDYYYNTGRRPEDLLLYTDGTITLNQLNSKGNHRSLWKKHRGRIFRSFEHPTYVNRLDSAKDRVYRSTKMVDGQPNPAYEKTWKPRVWMWTNQPSNR